MPRSSGFVGLLLLLFFCFSSLSLYAETIELATYYPAAAAEGPMEAGRLHAGRATIGDPYSLTNPADADLPNGTLRVAGRIGIGTAAPQMDLEVYRADESTVRVWGTGINAAPENFAGLELGSDLPAGGGIDRIWQIAHKRGGRGGLNDLQVSYFDGAVWTPQVTIRPGGSVGIGTVAPAASALLEMSSTARGFLPPRMDTARRDTIATPAEGLVIYNTDTGQLNLYNGTAWTIVASTVGGGITEVVFNVAGTTAWTVPGGVTQIVVEVWGGGGGGGGSGAVADHWGHGGGGGGYGRAIAAVTPGNNLAVTVGAGGTGFQEVATDGTAGGTSSVTGMNSPAAVSATGGAGGDGEGYTSANVLFGGGGSSMAPFNISGGRGQRIYGSVMFLEGGDAGNGGAGGVGIRDGPTGNRFRAEPGIAPGGGGPGWLNVSLASGNNNGAVGRVVITYSS